MKLPAFLEIKKNLKKDFSSFPVIPLGIIGDCATQHIAAALRGWGYEKRTAFQIFDSDYNQIDAQTMDPASELYFFGPAYVLVVNCTDTLYRQFTDTPVSQRSSFAEVTCQRMTEVWGRIAANSKARILQFNFPVWDDRVFGDFGGKTPDSFVFQTRKLNLLLAEKSAEYKNVFLCDVDGIQSRVGEKALRDAKMFCIAKMPFRTEILPAIAQAVTDTVLSAEGKIKKCVILDLDNTLWGGVVGDDGTEGIQIGELGSGHAFTHFQKWLKELKNRGIILCVCSKNNEETAKDPFLHHPEMVLRLEDISVFVANWEEKPANIQRIRDILNIGMDSMVFLDDNPFEREAVRSLLPDITVPELPENPEDYVDFLRGEELFGTASYSAEDGMRTDRYRAEAQRVSLQGKCADYDSYLESLEMVAQAKPFDPYHFPRIAQLTQRSNQFNLRTVRYTEQEIAAIASDDRYITLYFTLKDKFGDHGLISAVIMEKRSEMELFINTYLMSCRVLKRGMEEFIINTIIKTAAEQGFKRVIGEYLPTAKNSMVADIYKRLGFTQLSDTLFTAGTEAFAFNKTHIQKGN